MLRRLLTGLKGFKYAMAMQNPAKAKAVMDRAEAGDEAAQRICVNCYCEMSQMIPQTALQALHAADGLLADSYRRGEATGKPAIDLALTMNLRSVDRGSYVGAVNLAEEYAQGEYLKQDCRKALEYIQIAEERLAERVTNSEEDSRKLFRFARTKIDHIKVIAIRQLGAEQLGR
jgi:TPR repeat protein